MVDWRVTTKQFHKIEEAQLCTGDYDATNPTPTPRRNPALAFIDPDSKCSDGDDVAACMFLKKKEVLPSDDQRCESKDAECPCPCDICGWFASLSTEDKQSECEDPDVKSGVADNCMINCDNYNQPTKDNCPASIYL